jgi:hypothetical protein
VDPLLAHPFVTMGLELLELPVEGSPLQSAAPPRSTRSSANILSCDDNRAMAGQKSEDLDSGVTRQPDCASRDALDV